MATSAVPVIVHRATYVPHRMVNPGTEQITTVTLTPPVS